MLTHSHNRVLAQLSPQDLLILSPHLEPIIFTNNQSLYDNQTLIHYLYFPIKGIISIRYITNNGNLMEITSIGNEGMAGNLLFMSDIITPEIAIVQMQGKGYRLSIQNLKKELSLLKSLPSILLRYTQLIMTQAAQLAVCHRYHRIDAQLCHWLLSRLDHLQNNTIYATHESIATMLGVRREGVTKAAFQLQKLGIIHYKRGQIVILDRRALEEKVCECYAFLKKEKLRLFGTNTET